jgi:hypothetical protein
MFLITGNRVILGLVKRFFLSYVLLALGYQVVSAQSNYYVEVSGNYSFISSEEYIVSMPATFSSTAGHTFRLREEYKTVPGFDIGVGKTWNITSRLFIESGLSVRQIGYSMQNRLLVNESSSASEIGFEGTKGIPYGSLFAGDAWIQDGVLFVDVTGSNPTDNDLTSVSGTPSEYRTSLYYLDLPLSVQYTILKDRFSAGIGIQPSFLAYGKVSYDRLEYPPIAKDSSLLARWTRPASDTIRITTLSPVVRTVTDDSGNGFKNMVWHGNILSKYRLFERLWLSAAYYHAFVPLQDNQRGKARFIKLGIRYTF